VSDAAFPWTPLRASRSSATLAAGAAALTVGIVVLVGVARWLDTPKFFSPALPLAALAAIATLWIRSRRPRTAHSVEVRIDPHGRIEVRCGELTSAARPHFIGAWLIVLEAGAKHIVIWRDSLEPDQFRRLSAVARWSLERTPRAADIGEVDMDQTGTVVAGELKPIGRVSVEQVRGGRHAAKR
jgi:hypothetical protein